MTQPYTGRTPERQRDPPWKRTPHQLRIRYGREYHPASLGEGERLENQYDAEYLRAGTIENGEKRTFLYYNGELLAEADQEEEPVSRYILGYGVAAYRNRGKEGYHSCHQDEQNSTVYLLGADGEIKNAYQYDAFGVIRTSREELPNRILYTRQQYDQISSQYYLRARYYNPVVGRFLQEDVYRGEGLNLYVYCGNNPVVYSDPSGFSPNPLSLLNSSSRYPANGDQSSIVQITMTGARGSDFTAAFKKSRIKKSEAIGYTWHHEPDFDPNTGMTTMVLVKTSMHEENLPHSGSVSQYEKQFGVKYETYEAKMISYKNKWRDKEPRQRKKKENCKEE